ncbi:MAG: hypothetical protein WAU86_20550 [Oricola sp.]
MFQSGDKRSKANLLDVILENDEGWRKAVRQNDISRANRHTRRITEAVIELREDETGRELLEQLLSSPIAHLRLWAAGSVMKWDPDRAIPVLARLLFETLDEGSTTEEIVHVQFSAEGYLARHFGLHHSDLRRLPERLAAMGIGLPDELVTRLTRA